MLLLAQCAGQFVADDRVFLTFESRGQCGRVRIDLSDCPSGVTAHDRIVVIERFAESRQMRVIPWTVNERADMIRLMDLGVSGIITDYPDVLVALVGE